MLGHICYPEFTVSKHSSLSPSWCNHKGCFKKLQYGIGQRYPKDNQVTVTVSGITGHLHNAPLQWIAAGLLWDSKTCCNFMYSWGWYFWLTPEMVKFFLLFQSVVCLWQTKMKSSFVVVKSRSHSLFPKHCSLLVDCLLKDLWMTCLFYFTDVPTSLTLGDVFLENSGYC